MKKTQPIIPKKSSKKKLKKKKKKKKNKNEEEQDSNPFITFSKSSKSSPTKPIKKKKKSKLDKNSGNSNSLVFNTYSVDMILDEKAKSNDVLNNSQLYDLNEDESYLSIMKDVDGCDSIAFNHGVNNLENVDTKIDDEITEKKNESETEESITKNLKKKLDNFSVDELLSWNHMYDSNLLNLVRNKKNIGSDPKNSSILRILNGRTKRNSYSLDKGNVFARLSDERFFSGTAGAKQQEKVYEANYNLTEENLEQITQHYIEKYLKHDEKKELV